MNPDNQQLIERADAYFKLKYNPTDPSEAITTVSIASYLIRDMRAALANTRTQIPYAEQVEKVKTAIEFNWLNLRETQRPEDFEDYSLRSSFARSLSQAALAALGIVEGK